MNAIDRLVLYFSPAAGKSRVRDRLAAKMLYEAGEPSRFRRQKAKRGSADVSVARAGNRLMDSARYLDENFDIASGALDLLVTNIVGTGIRPEPSVMTLAGEPADEVNDQIRTLFKHWSKSPDVSGEYDLAQYQRLIVRSTFRDGDAFTRTISGKVAGLERKHGVPFWLEAMESDFVDLQHNELSKGIIQGIQRNKWGAPSVYHAYKSHPAGLVSAPGKRPIPAAQMIHSKITKRLNQNRGVTVFATVFNRLDDIKEIDESERVAARVAAAMAAYVKKGTPDVYDSDEADEDRLIDWSPGQVFDNLQPGEDIGTINSNRPNNALIPFKDSQMRHSASGLCVSYSGFSKNYNGTYSAQRQELVEQYGAYGVLWSYFARQPFQMIYERFIDAAIASGMLKVAGIDELTLYDCQHSRPPMVWIDPLKEAKANKEMRENDWTSDGQIIRDKGGDPNEVYRQIARDKKDKEAAGIIEDPETTETTTEE